MTLSLGVNLRVTGHCNQGGRKYMEDVFSVAYQQTSDEKDLEYAFFGMFDGHGGREAAQYSKDHLMDSITKNKLFWSEDDDSVLKAIREGFLSTQQAMWNELPNWRKTATGLPSTAGTTASICFIKRGKLFIGHVGDSGIILGERDPTHPSRWRAKPLTREHKPESEMELERIEAAGGKVMSKAGVHRVVWYRPSNGALHQGPVRRSTNFDEVPFLAVARALGDLWSYNSEKDMYIVSPEPDLHVFDLNVLKDRCLVLATDGAWNVLSPEMAIEEVFASERNNEKHMIDPQGGHTWVNPSKRLVDIALDRWKSFKLRADNTSIVTVMLDPPGPPRAQVLKRIYSVQTPKTNNELQTGRKQDEKEKVSAVPVTEAQQKPDNEESHIYDLENTAPPESINKNDVHEQHENANKRSSCDQKKPNENGVILAGNKNDADPIAVISRHPNKDQIGWNVVKSGKSEDREENAKNVLSTLSDNDNFVSSVPLKPKSTSLPIPSYLVHPPPPPRNLQSNRPINANALEATKRSKVPPDMNHAESVSEEQTPSSTSHLGIQETTSPKGAGNRNGIQQLQSPVQINEITSSDDEKTPPPLPRRPPGGHGALNKRKVLGLKLADQRGNNFVKTDSGNGAPLTDMTKCNETSKREVAKTAQSNKTESFKDRKVLNTVPSKEVPSFNSNTSQNLKNMSAFAPRRPPRRSVVMPPGEELESPTYNSDSENHQPLTHQLRSRATTRSSSVPLQCSSSHSANRKIRSTSCASDKKKGDTNEEIKPSVVLRNKISPKVPTNAGKQMAVNIDNRSSKLPQQPPPLPARPTNTPSKILRSSNTPNVKSIGSVKPLPDKSLQTPSPRVLRPRNTPTVKNSLSVTPGITSKIISTPKHETPIGSEKDKKIPTKITARAVKFFEENIKRNSTSLKRKRRSFDTSGHSIPINKSAKLVRTAHTTRSCTWNNHTHTAQSRSQLQNSLCSKKQPSQNKITPSKCKGLKN